MNSFAATLLAFLPQRYRGRFSSYRIPAVGAIIGGFAEFFLSLVLLIHRYQLYSAQRLSELNITAMTAMVEKNGESAPMGVGTIIALEYLLHFSTLLLIFFALEGIVRAVGAIASNETLPSLPLHLLASLQTQLEARGREMRLGQRVADEVILSGDAQSLQIASCRPKKWSQLTTISYLGELYELANERKGEAARPFIYVLQRKPLSSVVRGIYHYDPNEVLEDRK